MLEYYLSTNFRKSKVCTQIELKGIKKEPQTPTNMGFAALFYLLPLYFKRTAYKNKCGKIKGFGKVLSEIKHIKK